MRLDETQRETINLIVVNNGSVSVNNSLLVSES